MLFISLWSLFSTCCRSARYHFCVKPIILVASMKGTFVILGRIALNFDSKRTNLDPDSVWLLSKDVAYASRLMVCQFSDVFQRVIILWVRALDTNHSKERTTERLTQIPLSRTKIKEMLSFFFFNLFFYHRYLDKCIVRYLDPIHFYQIGLGSGSSRDGRTQSVFERHASW